MTPLLWLHRKLRRLRVRRVSGNGSAATSRVAWEIDGDELWFECGDEELSQGPAAAACLCFAAASLGGWRVRFPEPLSPGLLRNLKKLAKIWRRWWKCESGRFRARQSAAAGPPAGQRGFASFLSLGVDSFYTLLHRPDIDTIVYVAGYDVKLDDRARLEGIERSLRAVGAARGLKVILVRTNLRSHPVFRALNWERFHGAALAAVGHLLENSVRGIVISASYPLDFFQPWGSSWKTDPLWSSERFEVAHFGEDLWRFGKLEKIAAEPLVREHLRICWEQRNERPNCGRCEKCLRTMLGLLSLGQLRFYPNFPGARVLNRSLGNTKRLPRHLVPTYRRILRRGLPPATVKVLRPLIRRSKTSAADQ